MKFSKFFKLDKEQAELDFVDVDPDKDTQLYVDPYAIEIKNDQWSTDCGDHIRSFFEEVLAALRNGNDRKAQDLMSHLHEPRETFLGVSRGIPQGRGVGSFQGKLILNALRNSVAFKTGLLSDLAEAELFIDGIGRDKTSDLTTNIIRGPLVAYTNLQCELHDIPTYTVASAPIWVPTKARWESTYVKLPKIGRRPILLVPKYSVRRQLSLESQEFYNHHMIEFLRAEYEATGSGLVNVLRSGRVYKKDVKARHPKVKDDLAKFVIDHPDVLETYKSLKGAQGPLDNSDFDEDFDEVLFGEALKTKLRKIPVGGEAASQYHTFAAGLLTFLFYPDLICPIKEKELHGGLKRIDIVFTNAATEGFFSRMLKAPQTRSLSVPVECKNYSSDVSNPELDQLSSRFGHQRGFFGILTCRTDRPLSKDAARLRKICGGSLWC